MLFYFLKKPILVLLRIRDFFNISFVIFDKVVNIMIKSPEKKVTVMFSSGQGLSSYVFVRCHDGMPGPKWGHGHRYQIK